MPFVAKIKESLGRAVLSAQMAVTDTAQNFIFQQIQKDLGQVNAVAPQTLSFGLRTYAKTLQASQEYGYPMQGGDFRTYNIAWNQTKAITANDLATLVNAAEDYVTLTPTSLGAFDIEAKKGSDDFYGLIIEFSNLALVSVASVNETLDLTTDNTPCILKATVSGADIRYDEHQTPTASVGQLVVDEGVFDITGAENIINAKVIEVSGAPVVDYNIYI